MGLRDECGVTGIYGADNAAHLVYYALNSLQHRGQESAGIAVCTTGDKINSAEKIKLHRGMGLAGEVFKAEHFCELEGNMAIGHVRYATAGARTIENAQPFVNTYKFGSIALAHNGQLVNHSELRSLLEDSGSTFNSTSDSEVILKLIVRKFIDRGGKPGHSLTEDYEENKKRFEQAIVETASLIKGSFALCIMTSDCLIAVRDPGGIRPLCLGQIKNNSASLKSSKSENSYIVASESCAIDAVNGTFMRDIEPGEILIINKDGLRSIKYSDSPKKTCIFEYVYFARPDSIIDGVSVQEARYNMGSVLAKESPVEADVIIGVPDSGIGAAMGYAKESKIPYVTGIVKNKYIGRTFIAPTQAEREAMVFVKLNAIKSDINGKKVVVIDDSIVRGTTSRRLVELLRRAGAKEVHFRVSSPPVKFPCHLGIDTPSKGELISSTHELEEIRREIGADSLAFISLEGMIKALQTASGVNCSGFCEGCFSGDYPV